MHKLHIKNRRAYHDFEILESLEAGIVLKGTEVKSLQNGKASLEEAFVQIKEHKVVLTGCFISHYHHGNIHNHEEKRPRQLLLHKREKAKLKAAIKERGLTIIPLEIYRKNNYIKVKIALARGKKLYDKRIKERAKEDARNIERAIKS